MSGTTLEAPYSIASLPRPLDKDKGQTFAAPVFGIRDGRSRKRHEVVVGIDGESVNIYNVQSQNLVTSYPLPPQTYLCCPPCSVYVRVPSEAVSRRETYIVVKDGFNQSKRRLICIYEETATRSQTQDFRASRPKNHEVSIPSVENVVSLAVIPSGVEGSFHTTVTVAFEKGEVWAVGGHYGQSWQERAPGVENLDGLVVEHAAVIAADTASTGLLKNREDALAQILPATRDSAWPNSHLMCQLVRTNSGRQFRLYAVDFSHRSPIETWRSHIRFLLLHELPAGRQADAQAVSYELHAASGRLYELCAGILTIYDIAQIVPRVVTEVGNDQGPIEAFSRLSASAVITVSGGYAAIHETTFGAIQASVALQPLSDASGHNRKRKREDDESGPSTSFRLVSAFPDIGSVIVISGQQLETMQFRTRKTKSGRAQSRRTLLSEVMGKRKARHARVSCQAEDDSAQDLQWKSKVDELIRQRDFKGLEAFTGIALVQGSSVKKRQRRQNGDPDRGHIALADSEAILRGVDDVPQISPTRVSYLLKQVFSSKSGAEGQLELQITSSKTLIWLAVTGHMSRDQVQQVVPELTIQQGDLMDAVARADDTFCIMLDLLAAPVHWDLVEMMRALHLILGSFDTPSESNGALALPASRETGAEAETLDGDAEAQILREADAAQKELERTSKFFELGLDVRRDALRTILVRLHAFPADAVTGTMRSRLSQEHILFLIGLMRIELANGGWTSRYVNTDEDLAEGGMVNRLGGVEDGEPSDQAIKAIGDLLNCCIDAVGTNGWLVGLSGHAQGIRELVEDLRAEISAGLEGCYEAVSLGALLDDVRRLAAKSPGASKAISPVERDSAALPLSSGSRRPPGVGSNPKDKRRQKMEVAHRKSRNVGKYSIDRIRL